MRRELLSDPLDGVLAFNPLATGDRSRHGAGYRCGLGAAARSRRKRAACRFASHRRQRERADRGGRPHLPGLCNGRWKTLPQRLLRPFILCEAMTALAPERSLFEHGAILVNRDGRTLLRGESARTGRRFCASLAREAFILFDARLREVFERWPNFVSTAPGFAYAYMSDYRRVRPDLYTLADGPLEMAQRLKMDPAKGWRPTLAALPGAEWTHRA